GYVRMGSSVALRSLDRVPGPRCPGGFYAVEPRGFVCNDRTVTLSPSPRFIAVAAAAAPSPRPLPYRYAFSDGAPMYSRLPTPEEEERVEGGMGPADSQTRARKGMSTYDDLASKDAFGPVEPAPPFLASTDRLGHETIPAGSMLSFTRTLST